MEQTYSDLDYVCSIYLAHAHSVQDVVDGALLSCREGACYDSGASVVQGGRLSCSSLWDPGVFIAVWFRVPLGGLIAAPQWIPRDGGPNGRVNRPSLCKYMTPLMLIPSYMLFPFSFISLSCTADII